MTVESDGEKKKTFDKALGVTAEVAESLAVAKATTDGGDVSRVETDDRKLRAKKTGSGKAESRIADQELEADNREIERRKIR